MAFIVGEERQASHPLRDGDVETLVFDVWVEKSIIDDRVNATELRLDVMCILSL